VLTWKLHYIVQQREKLFFARLYKGKRPQLLATSAYKSEAYLRKILTASKIEVNTSHPTLEQHSATSP
jgi:hypothetical protein